MKKSPGRKERRRLARANRRSAGREKAKWNNWMRNHPNDNRTKRIESEEI